MTPVYANPSHVDDVEKQLHYSNVFHFEHPGLLQATFYGKDHKENAVQFCKMFGKASTSE